MVSPTRGGITSPKRTMAPPTTRMVSVWPTPHRAPMAIALVSERWRLTMVVTAMT